MNERIEPRAAITMSAALVPIFEKLVADYLLLLGGEPSVIRELVEDSVIQHGLQATVDWCVEEANRRFARDMGWPLDEEEMGT